MRLATRSACAPSSTGGVFQAAPLAMLSSSAAGIGSLLSRWISAHSASFFSGSPTTAATPSTCVLSSVGFPVSCSEVAMASVSKPSAAAVSTGDSR
ncbi:hypothetical protein D9M68_855360 [compost metagenome]